jgi:hypothetical protein
MCFFREFCIAKCVFKSVRETHEYEENSSRTNFSFIVWGECDKKAIFDKIYFIYQILLFCSPTFHFAFLSTLSNASTLLLSNNCFRKKKRKVLSLYLILLHYSYFIILHFAHLFAKMIERSIEFSNRFHSVSSMTFYKFYFFFITKA